MCRFKSAIIMKDSIYMPNFDSHTKMLEELNIPDTNENAQKKFIRAEIFPRSGDLFENIGEWRYHVDQDILPEWYVSDYDEQRMRNALTDWIETFGHQYCGKSQLGKLAVGEKFIIGNIEYVLLSKTKDDVLCITADLINPCKAFDGSSNVFENSSIKRYLNGPYRDSLLPLIGGANIVGDISLLSREQYKKFRSQIPNIDKWWWLKDPWPDTTHRVCVVLSYFGCAWGYGGVRPVCTFKSSIVVSCVKQEE